MRPAAPRRGVDPAEYAWLAGLAVILVITLRHLGLKPSNEREWVVENRRMAYADFDGDEVTLRNVRDFRWRTTRDFDERWTCLLYTSPSPRD